MRAWKQIKRGSLSYFGKLLARPFEHQGEHRLAVKTVGISERKLVNVKPEMLETVFHFFTFAFLRRANAPSWVNAKGSSPRSHCQRARGETSNSAAASACVSPRRWRSDLSRSEKDMGLKATGLDDLVPNLDGVPHFFHGSSEGGFAGGLAAAHFNNVPHSFMFRIFTNHVAADDFVVFHIVFSCFVNHFQRVKNRIMCE